MKKRNLLFLIIFLLALQKTYSQTDIDGLMMQKKFFCVILFLCAGGRVVNYNRL